MLVINQFNLGQHCLYLSLSSLSALCILQLGYVMLCQVRLGQVRLGQVRLGQVRLGQVRLGQVRLGQANSQYYHTYGTYTLLVILINCLDQITAFNLWTKRKKIKPYIYKKLGLIISAFFPPKVIYIRCLWSVFVFDKNPGFGFGCRQIGRQASRPVTANLT